MSEWKRGDLALIECGDGVDRLAYCRPDPYPRTATAPLCWEFLADGLRRDIDGTNARRVVALDLPDGAKAGWPVLVQALRAAREATGFAMTFDGLIEQIEAQTTSPKPPEPTGLGAVVVDRNDVTWVLAGRDDPNGINPDRWRAIDGPTVGDWRTYDRIDVARVLSEGVQA